MRISDWSSDVCSSDLAKYRTELYDEISNEYQSYKSRTNEKEKKLARELQDERNKLEEYKTRGI